MGRTLTWQRGRQLASNVKNNVTTTYKYDTDGLRTLQKIGDEEYKYTYINGQLYAYETGDMYMFFTYNDDGTPLGIIFNGIAYYYQTNL